MAETLNNDKEKKNILLAFFQCVIACAFIISCNSMWITLAPYDQKIKNMALILVLIGVLGSIIASRNFLNRKKMIISIIFTVCIGIYLLIFILITDFSVRRFLKDSLIFLALIFYYFLVEDPDETPKLLIRYEYIITAIAAVSIICWLVFSIFKLIPPSEPQMTWWNGTDHYTEVKSFYDIYFEPQTKWIFEQDIPRNCSIFTEGPMASLHFSFALLTCLFLRKKTSVIRSIILLIALLTTFSATGIVACALGIALKILLSIFSSERYKRIGKGAKAFFKVLGVIIIIVVVIIFIFVMRNRVGGESYNIRVEDFRATFLAWFDSPIVGNGIYNFDAVKMHFEGARATYAGFSCSNSLGTILADGGAMFGLLYIGSFICALIKAVKNKEYNVLFFAVIAFIIFSVTIVAYDYMIMFIFIFFGAYKCRSRKFLERKLFAGRDR